MPIVAWLIQHLKGILGPRGTTRLRCIVRGRQWPRWGNLRRVTPFSTHFGFDRGTPVDRYYLHKFLDAHRPAITGDVLEVQSPGHALRYGSNLRHVHSVDINPRFSPTYLCDLSRASDVIPSEAYDCFLLPNTLQHVRDVEACLREVLRVIRPGGTILASAPGFVPLIPDGPDYWRLTGQGWTEMALRAWVDCDVEIGSNGNCLTATAAMLGLALEELDPSELEVNDPRYPVLVTLRCRKPRSQRR